MTYNDLLNFNSHQVLQEIKDMPEPSYEQAEEIQRRWTNMELTESHTLTESEVFYGLILAKLYRKCKDTHPEIFI